MVKKTVVHINKFRKQPSSIQAEYSVLGGLLLDNTKFQDIANMLCENDFYSDWHKKLFKAMREVHAKYNQIDAMLLTEHLQCNTDEVAMIYTMANECPSSRNVKAYAAIIREKSVQRQLIAVATDLMQEQRCSNNINWPNYTAHVAERVESLHNSLIPKPMTAQEEAKERLAMYLEETAAEIRASDITQDYMQMLSLEVNRALVCSFYEFEDLEDRNATNKGR